MRVRSKRYIVFVFVLLTIVGISVAAYHIVTGYPSDSHVTNAISI